MVGRFESGRRLFDGDPLFRDLWGLGRFRLGFHSIPRERSSRMVLICVVLMLGFAALLTRLGNRVQGD